MGQQYMNPPHHAAAITLQMTASELRLKSENINM
jgi:hypothetical protein